MRCFFLPVLLLLAAGLASQTPFPLQQYGQGGAGQGLYVPTFHTTGRFPVLGNQGFQLLSRNLQGGAPGVLFFGLEAADITLAGLTFHIDPQTNYPAYVQANNQGEAAIPLPVPKDPALAGYDLFLQAFFQDQAAPVSLVHTQGLALHLVPSLPSALTALYDRTAYASYLTSPSAGQALWQAHALPGFSYLKTQLFAAGGQSHQMVLIQHAQTGIEFVLVPGDSFRMGDLNGAGGQDEQPVHWVHVPPFLLARTEVTQGQFQQVMKSTPWLGMPGVWTGAQAAQYTANYIDWAGATAFCDKLGWRLPTEAEWEYACRAGTGTLYHFGGSAANLGSHGWYWSNAGGGGQAYAHQAGAKLPNAFGLFDMHGNLREWCQDVWQADYAKAPTNGGARRNGAASFRVLRGGGWLDRPADCRSARRALNPPTTADHQSGFRPALTLPGGGIVLVKRIVEDFTGTGQEESGESGAFWGQGRLTAGYLGGSGILGEFDHRVGSVKRNNVYVFDGDGADFPASVTLDGKPRRVTDGVFAFASFRIPKDVTVRFEGSRPVRILVRGSVAIEGRLEVDGYEPMHAGPYNSIGGEKGAPGGRGGPGGAAGGRGGGEPGSGQGPDGLAGGDLAVPAGHPRASQANWTGGKGGLCFPRTAGGQVDPTAVRYDYYAYYSLQFAGFGGPGSYTRSGTFGSIKENQASHRTVHGPFPGLSPFFQPLPLNTGKEVIDQLLIGGAGGGGGGVCPYGSLNPTPSWQRGNGGGGGGGALAIRCGNDFALGLAGWISARGGTGGGGNGTVSGTLTPGGGGSGGTILVQAGDQVLSQGTYDLRGGEARKFSDVFLTHQLISAGGGPGFLRVEAPTAPGSGSLGTVFPTPTPQNVGTLTDRVPVTGSASKWYRHLFSSPRYLHYEIEATIGTTKVVYTDDPAAPNPCVLGKTPVAVFFKGARLDAAQQVLPSSLTWWVSRPADLADPAKNGGAPLPPQVFRWTLLIDESLAPGKIVAIDRITVVVSN